MEINEEMDKIFEKYKYSEELREALRRCVPAMIEGKNEEEIELLVEALNNVEIFIFDKEPTKEQKEEIKKMKLNGRNQHVKDITSLNGRSEYERNQTSPAAYCSEVIYNEEMKPIDKIEYLYVTRLKEDDRLVSTYNTTIDLSHLIHELGHAWAAQKNHYIELENGNVQMNHGLRSAIYEVDKANHTIELIESNGIFLEEAFNTIEEERAITRILGVNSIKEVDGYSKSVYQLSEMTELARAYSRVAGERFEIARMHKEYDNFKEIQGAYDRTDISHRLNSQKYLEDKKQYFFSSLPNNAIDFFERNSSLYFSPNSKNDFLGNLDRAMGQLHSLFTGNQIIGSISNYDKEHADGIIKKIIFSEGIQPLKETAEIVIAERKKSITPQTVVKEALRAGTEPKDLNSPENDLDNLKREGIEQSD